MAISKEAEEFVGIAADNIIAIDDLVAEKREEFADLYMELLNSPDRRNDKIEVKYVTYLYQQSIVELGNSSMLPYWQTIADNMEMTFDELNQIPTNLRGDVFSETRKIMSAVSWEQAFIESGIAEAAIRSGLKMGDVIQAFSKVIDPKEFDKGTGIKQVRDQKLLDREVGTKDSPIAGENNL
jgi:superfamily I DNA and/or RNA helicase